MCTCGRVGFEEDQLLLPYTGWDPVKTGTIILAQRTLTLPEGKVPLDPADAKWVADKRLRLA